jgi:hypothetical protein
MQRHLPSCRQGICRNEDQGRLQALHHPFTLIAPTSRKVRGQT